MMYYPGYAQGSPSFYTNIFSVFSSLASSCCAVCALLTAITSGVTPRIITAA